MKILVIAPTPFFADRGTHIRILEESLALEKIGHELTIATYHIGEGISDKVATNIDVRRIRRLLFWYKKLEAGPDWQKIILDLMLVRKAFYLARTQKPDIIHAHLHEGVLIGWIVQKLLFWRNMKLVADFHGSLTKEMVSHGYLDGGLIKTFFKRIEWWVDNLGDCALASSWENSEELKKIRKDGKVETILDGVNTQSYANLPTKKQLRNTFEIPEEKVVITYTGALISNKGIGYLLQSLLEVIGSHPEAYFIIAGFPIAMAQQYVKQHRLEQHVRLISPLSYFDLPKILALSDLAVDPKDSSTNQASGKILQYMAAGLPVVCFDRENNRNYLAEGAFYCPEVSEKSLGDTMCSAIEQRGERESKGAHNRIRSEQFGWNISAQKISTLYNKVIA